jgi:hypothetical protein
MALYTFSSLQGELILRLGGRGDVSTRAATWINTAMEALATCQVSLPALEKTVDKLLVVGVNEYVYNAAPWSILDLLGIRGIRNTTAKYRLTWWSWAEYRQLSTLPSGTANRWTRFGYTVAFDQIPTATDSLKIDYRRHPTHDTLADFEDQWHELLLNMALAIGWNALQDYSQAAIVTKLLPMFIQAAIQLPMTPEEWEAGQGDRAMVLASEYLHHGA